VFAARLSFLLDPSTSLAEEVKMLNWYAISTLSGQEKRAKRDLEFRFHSLGLDGQLKRVVIPSETVVIESKGKKRECERRVMPGYLLVNMHLTEESLYAVNTTPGLGGFVGSDNSRPVPLSREEVARFLRTEEAPIKKKELTFRVGEEVRIVSGPLTDFEGFVEEVNEDRRKLRVVTRIFERDTPVEVGYDQVERKNKDA
jgi:transcriptional antiterminator NusG